MPKTPDLAIIATPPYTVPTLIDELGARGSKVAVVLTAGLDLEYDAQGQTVLQAMLDAARPHGLRILGPNSVGVLVPAIGLNASFAHACPLPGEIAFVTQSGSLATVVLDWANSEEIGFSSFVSLGNSADIDFGDVLAYLHDDEATRAILLYMESIEDASKFMAAARALACEKTVIAVKAGRSAEGARAAASHTGALAGADDVFDAALRRAGILRVDAIEDLFNALETLNRARALRGDRLTIFTNGGGTGVIATDALAQRGGRLTSLSPETLARLDSVLPKNWSRGNPVDIIGDATPDRYVEALHVLLQDPGTNALLFLQAPSAIVPSEEIATVLAPIMQATERTVLTCWLGRESANAARRICAEAGIPVYDTPRDGVEAFLQMVNHRHIRTTLLETAPCAPTGVDPLAADKARAVVESARAAGRHWLTECEAKAMLVAYSIPSVNTRMAESPVECKGVATTIGFPVALKIVSPDIIHKSDVGGVALHLTTPEEVFLAAKDMSQQVRTLCPDAKVIGYSVQEMAYRPHAHELIVGVTTDPIFGHVILFGQGGTAVEVICDRAVELPPLTLSLARNMVGRTRVARLLAGYRNHPRADLDAIYQTLLKVAQMVGDIPEICELDINPLLVDDKGVLALDARIYVRCNW